MPAVQLAVAGYAATWALVLDDLPQLEAALPGIKVRVGFVVGAASPMPTSASTDTAGGIPGAWVDVVPAAVTSYGSTHPDASGRTGTAHRLSAASRAGG